MKNVCRAEARQLSGVQDRVQESSYIGFYGVDLQDGEARPEPQSLLLVRCMSLI